jgi:endonuclease YncB( thermonuclease family)
VGAVVAFRPQTIDKNGRTVAEVFRGGQNTNLGMVFSGQAFARTRAALKDRALLACGRLDGVSDCFPDRGNPVVAVRPVVIRA